MKRLAFLSFAALLAESSAYAQQLSITDVSPDGIDAAGNPMASGRVQDVDVDPSTLTLGDRRYLAASDAGGMWESLDSGVHWHHVRGLDPFGQAAISSILFDPDVSTPGHTQRVLATTWWDHVVPSQAGVYFSDDAGQSWTAPGAASAHCQTELGIGTNRPPWGFGCDRSLQSRRVVFDPTNRRGAHWNVWVGANCGLGYSADGGATFDWMRLFNAAGAAVGGIHGVAVGTDGRAYACAADGVFRQDRIGDPCGWSIVTGTTSLGLINCEIAASPVATDHVFIAAGTSNLTHAFEVYSDGSAWHTVDLAGHGDHNGRPVIMETSPAFAAAPLNLIRSEFRLYYNDSRETYVQTCSRYNAPTQCLGPWTHMSVSHLDNARILFGPDSCALLMAGDGGIQVPGPGTSCSGTDSTWVYSNQGLHTHLMGHLAGTLHTDGTSDLYTSLLDNGFMFRPSHGGAWTQTGGGDGVYVTADLFDAGLPLRVLLTEYDNALYHARQFLPSIDPMSAFPAPYFPRVTRSGRRVAEWLSNGSYASVGEAGGMSQLFVTDNDGQSWTPVLPNPLGANGRSEVRASLPVLRRSSIDRVLYVRTADQLWAVTRRLAISGFPPRPQVTWSDVQVTPTPGAAVGFFGVALNDADRLYAYDCNGTQPCFHGHVVSTFDGGRTWQEDPVLTRLMQTDAYGNFYGPGTDLSEISPDDSENVQPQMFAFDPRDERIIIAGMYQTGVFVSIDGGSSWGRLPLHSVYNTSGAAFTGPASDRGHFFISFFGSGLFEIRLGGTSLAIQPPPPRGSTWNVRLSDMNNRPVGSQPIIFSAVDASGVPTVIDTADTNPTNGLAGVSTDLIPAGSTLRARFEGAADASGVSTLVGAESEMRYPF